MNSKNRNILCSLITLVVISGTSQLSIASTGLNYVRLLEWPTIYGYLAFGVHINDRGQIVTSTTNSSYPYGVNYLIQNGNFTILPSEPYYGGLNEAEGINNLGQILINTPCAIYDGVNLIQIQGIPSTAYCLGMNDYGQIVGYYSDENYNLHGFLFDRGNFINKDIPGAGWTILTDINNNGQIVGFFTDNNGWHGVEYDGANIKILDSPPEDYLNFSYATGINDKGQVVGFGLDVTGTFPIPWLYDGTKISTLMLPSCMDYFSPTDINNAGDMVGFAGTEDPTCGPPNYLNPGWTGSVKLASLIKLVDPVPDLVPELSISSPFDYDKLAKQGNFVDGAAADGVTKLLLQIPASSEGDALQLTVLDDQGNPTDSSSDDMDKYGALSDLNPTDPLQGSVSVSAVNTSAGPMAFALYHAPTDFVRDGNSDDPGKSDRTVTVRMERSGGGGAVDVPIKIVRPPLALIHGNWSNPWEDWCCFDPLFTYNPLYSDPRFFIGLVDYHTTLDKGFRDNAARAQEQIENIVSMFKLDKFVAAVQADVVAYSMGGDVARTMPLLYTYFQDANYQQGVIHKLITLDTPHLGSELATQLLSSAQPSEFGQSCQFLFSKEVGPVGDNVVDLSPGSLALSRINEPLYPPQVHLKAHVVSGIASLNQIDATDINYLSNTVTGIALRTACPDLLSRPPGNYVGVDGIFTTIINPTGESDLIVSKASQLGLNVGVDGLGFTVPSDLFQNTIHTTNDSLFTEGPDILNRVYTGGHHVGLPLNPFNEPNTVINLLNRPVTDSTYFVNIKP